MAQYSELPMDLADATLVAVAEELGQRRMFTLDTGFQICRLHGRNAFDILPAVRRSGSRRT